MNILPEWESRIKKLQIDWRIFAVSVLSGMICHIYCMVNLIATEDTAGSYGAGNVKLLSMFAGADTGRWLSGLVNRIQGWYRTPIISGCLIILIMALMAQLLIRLFRIESAAGRVLTAILLEVSSPTQAYMTLYEVGYPMSALLAVLAACFMVKAGMSGKKYWILSVLCESAALCILPVNVSCTLTVLWLLIVLHVTDPDCLASGNAERRWGLGCLCSLAVSGAFLLLSSRMLMRVFSIAQTSYQGAEAAMNGSFIGSLLPNYLHSFAKLFIMGGWKIQTMPALQFTYYICYFLDIVCVIRLLTKCNGKAERAVKMLFCLALLPAAVCTMSLVSYGFMYRGQHRQAFILFVLGTIPLTEKLLTAEHQYLARWKRAVYLTLTGDLALMCYGSFLFANIGYFNQHHVIAQDRSLCTRILSSLDQAEGFHYDQPVYFLNLLSWEGDASPTSLKYDPELYSVIWPVATTDLYAYGDSSFRLHMQSYEGVELEKPAEELCEEIENSELRTQYADMKSGDFAVVQYKNVWVVVVRTVGPPNVLYG